MLAQLESCSKSQNTADRRTATERARMRSKSFRKAKLNLQLAETNSAFGCIAHSPKGSRSIRTYRFAMCLRFRSVFGRLLGEHPGAAYAEGNTPATSLRSGPHIQHATCPDWLRALCDQKAWAPRRPAVRRRFFRRCVRAGILRAHREILSLRVQEIAEGGHRRHWGLSLLVVSDAARGAEVAAPRSS